MQCGNPTLVYNRLNGKREFRHFDLASEIFIRQHNQRFDCRKCLHCRQRASYELALRCELTANMYRDNSFLTLTYDESKPEYHNNFHYKDIQDFKKKYRQYVWRSLQRRIEIFNVHEYGTKGKKHWHLLVFNHDFSEETGRKLSPDGTPDITYNRKFKRKQNGNDLYTSEKLDDLWAHGLTAIGDVSAASAMYTAKYMEKDFRHGYVTSPKKSHSKHSGLGRTYFMRHYSQPLTLGYVPHRGLKHPVPEYFERLAHKHWSHFHEKSNFFDNSQRKRLYTPFKIGEENKEISDMFIEYRARKNEKLLQMQEEWNQTIQTFLTSKQDPDFIQSLENTHHNLSNKITKEKF